MRRPVLARIHAPHKGDLIIQAARNSPIQTLFPVSPLPMRTRLRDASVQRAMFRFDRHRESRFPNRSHSTDFPPHAREPNTAIQMAACVSPPHAREPSAAIQTAACVSSPRAREPGAAIQMAACVSSPHARGNDGLCAAGHQGCGLLASCSRKRQPSRLRHAKVNRPSAFSGTGGSSVYITSGAAARQTRA